MKALVLFAVLTLGGIFLAQAKKQFEIADAELNAAYKITISELNKNKIVQLREAQRAWIGFRDTQSSHEALILNGKTEHPEKTIDYWEMMTALTKERTNFLRAYSGKKVPPGITGEYTDCYGGALELEERKDGSVFFTIFATRGLAHNEGSMEGEFRLNENKASFKQQPTPDEPLYGPPCELAFTFSEGHIVTIDEKVPDSGAGHNVHYDGSYYKIGQLKKQEKEK